MLIPHLFRIALITLFLALKLQSPPMASSSIKLYRAFIVESYWSPMDPHFIFEYINMLPMHYVLMSLIMGIY
jgi:hypothetical protein